MHVRKAARVAPARASQPLCCSARSPLSDTPSFCPKAWSNSGLDGLLVKLAIQLNEGENSNATAAVTQASHLATDTDRGAEKCSQADALQYCSSRPAAV